MTATTLLDDGERAELAEALAAIHATADLAGRAGVRRRVDSADRYHEALDERQTLHPMAPAAALDWFRRLVPTLVVDSPEPWQRDLHQGAFTAAATTDLKLLRKIKGFILQALETGQEIRSTPQKIEQLLDAAGVSPANPQYAEMLTRTSMMRAYTEGATAEMRHPDVREAFPAWRYEGVRDGRQGKDHEPHFGKYYPNHVAFADVRGKRIWNCRCVPRPVSRAQWQRLQEQGHEFAAFAEDYDPNEPRDDKGRWTKGGAGKEGGARANARKAARVRATPPRLPSEEIEGPASLPDAEARAVGRIPPPRLDNYVRTVDGILTKRLPRAARDRVAKHVRVVKFHNSVEDVNAEILADTPGMKPVMDAHDGYYALAAYGPKEGTLYLDGNFGGEIDRVYAHELGHAIDGPGFELSGSREWQRLWDEEIRREKNPPLSHYANKSKVEAFAEFCAAVYHGGADLDEVARRLPGCAQFFKERELWPS